MMPKAGESLTAATCTRTLFQQGRDDGNGLLYAGGQELNTTSAQPLVEDPHASQAANWAYSQGNRMFRKSAA